ncbi:MAG: hypothetical protein A2031_02520 [Deltaproteobacteria bacterium RBG_19FT_COMBO_43_11]|nr:MAG: hypothetical protein A2031_02520 [Deltaproteobacteria bacterium RBG_19FT_COMBO_43_11]
MIIQCRQCRTKFFFEDSMMQGDGLWMRCSRCEHVFFQDNPFVEKPETEIPLVSGSVFSEDSPSDDTMGDLSKEAPPKSVRDEDVVRFLDNVMEAKKNLNEQVDLEMEKTRRESISKEKFTTTERISVVDDLSQEGAVKQKKRLSKKGTSKTWKVLVWAILVIVVIPAVIYFKVYPPIGDKFIEIAHKYIGDPEPARPEVVIGQVKLQDIRQRLIKSNVLGEIRVMEGTAVNQADYPICRIAIKGAIVDAYSVVLGERTSYAGNVLTDEELTNMSEEEILRKLSRLEGNNHSNDKIVSNGQIPFMIVFAREPAGVIKTTVTTVGAERLL